jgi:hypothetical protein
MTAALANSAPPSWTPARIALLVDHYHSGFSAAKSADLIGSVSKNTVVSKRRRLGLVATVAAGCVPGAGAGALGEGAVLARRRAERTRLFRVPPPMRTTPLPDMDFPAPPDGNPRRLTERRFGECAWPLEPAEEPGGHLTLFCGAPAGVGAAYCAAHAAHAYRRQP